MKKTKILFGVLLLATIIAIPFSCVTHKKAATDACVGVEASYSKDIAPIVQSNCMPCHKAGSSKGDWTTYNGLNEVAASGELKEHVFTKKDMPPADKPQLNDSQLVKLKCWIMNGHLNN
ncbi:MAG TPA: hypothetical protein VL651_02825 [Bacteroidia bacterium]|jgi:hypothetical protein|nr:hypothetical protein [Bacteroidia bacterium]